jgi:hypothetical protein
MKKRDEEEGEAVFGPCSEPRLGSFKDAGGMVGEDQLYRGQRRQGAVGHPKRRPRRSSCDRGGTLAPELKEIAELLRDMLKTDDTDRATSRSTFFRPRAKIDASQPGPGPPP